MRNIDYPSQFQEILNAAIADIVDNGFDSIERIDKWTRELRRAAEATMVKPASLEQMMRDGLAAIYARMIDRGGIWKFNPGAERFTLANVKPKLRDELDRRIMASANLIKLNRTQAIEKTLQRFQGWSTSIPKGGVSAETKQEIRKNVRKSLKQLPFEERRVLIDQGHKLTAALSEVIASDGGAIAGRWRSHWRQPGYDYREDHKDRDERFYLVRDSWADRAGLVKRGRGGAYYDEVTAVGQEPFCRCYMVWAYALRELPEDMITKKGRDALAGLKGARPDDSTLGTLMRLTRGQGPRLGPAEAEYVRDWPDRETRCAYCCMFVAPSACTLVRGEISVVGHCKEFEPVVRADGADDVLSAARRLDRLDYLRGYAGLLVRPDRGAWHSQYDSDTAQIILQQKFFREPPATQLQMMLHEIGHRGQDVDAKAYAEFKARHLNTIGAFRSMANETHLRDFRRKGHVDNIAEEVFAESYARWCMGKEMPEPLRDFWNERGQVRPGISHAGMRARIEAITKQLAEIRA